MYLFLLLLFFLIRDPISRSCVDFPLHSFKSYPTVRASRCFLFHVPIYSYLTTCFVLYRTLSFSLSLTNTHTRTLFLLFTQLYPLLSFSHPRSPFLKCVRERARAHAYTFKKFRSFPTFSPSIFLPSSNLDAYTYIHTYVKLERATAHTRTKG